MEKKTERALAAPSSHVITLAVRDAAKSFGATQAVRAATVEFVEGETHAIVGENGSGKSTLVKLIAGIQRPDHGVIEVSGQACQLATPRDALRRGIVAVFQEVLVVGPQSVLDNLWIGADGLWRRRVPELEKREKATAILKALLGNDSPDLGQPVEQLPLSIRQACGIARALLRDPKILILDESTSALDLASRDRLFDIVRQRNATGATVIFISHRMDEIHEIGDRVTVMRSGETIQTVRRGEAETSELVQMMTGEKSLVPTEAHQTTETRRQLHTVLRAEGLAVGGGAPINFSVRAGEIVGLAGLEGQGQDKFLQALAGHNRSAGSVLRVDEAGSEAPIERPEDALRGGVAYLPRDRRSESLFPTLSIRQNFAAATVASDRGRLLLTNRRTDSRLASHTERLRIRMAGPAAGITTLSGGNQQKVIIARWLAASPEVLLLNDPTRGVDIGAKRDIYSLLTDLALGGCGIVLVSTEVDELVELADRVIVFREDNAFCELTQRQLSRESLVGAFFGEEVAGA